MTNQYREMWTESGEIDKNLYSSSKQRLCLGKIILSKSQHKDSNNLFFTLQLKEDLFHNDDFAESVIKEVCALLNTFYKKYGIKKKSKIMVVGLGNEKVTADSLGGAVVDKLFVSSHMYEQKNIFERFGNLCALKCGVSGTTGIPSYEIVRAVTEVAKPDILIAIDTIASTSTSHLAKTIQLSDSGIEPGGGVNNPQTKLNLQTLGIPVIAIGVPLVIYVKRILLEYLTEENINIDSDLLTMVVTAKEVDFLIKDFSYILSETINRTTHNFKKEE